MKKPDVTTRGRWRESAPTTACEWRSRFTNGITAMIPPLNTGWLEFIEPFDANRVEYLIVGAFAVAHHGRPRLTCHLDFWVEQRTQRMSRS